MKKVSIRPSEAEVLDFLKRRLGYDFIEIKEEFEDLVKTVLMDLEYLNSWIERGDIDKTSQAMFDLKRSVMRLMNYTDFLNKIKKF